MTANEELQLRLSETLASLATGAMTADGLKDAWWLICHARRAALALKKQIADLQAQMRGVD